MDAALGKTHVRTVGVGGSTKVELLQNLKVGGIAMNDYAETLFACDLFTVSAELRDITIAEVTVSDLGYTQGASLPDIFSRAADQGLALCPLELAPYLRLQYREQPEYREAETPNRAPSGSITVASKPLTADDTFPKGFYLRKRDGRLWLRGYRCDALHIWSPTDHFVFVV